MCLHERGFFVLVVALSEGAKIQEDILLYERSIFYFGYRQ